MEHTLILFFSFFVEAVILWQYSSSLFVSVHTDKTRLFLLCVLYSILFFISLTDFTWMNALSYFLVNVIFFYTQFQLNLLAAFFHSAILTAIMGISELIFWGTLIRFAPNITVHYLSIENTIFFTVFNKTLFFTIIHFLLTLIKKKKIEQASANRSTLLLTAVPATSIFIMTTFVIISESVSFTPKHNFMVTLSAVSLLLSNLLIFAINQYNQKKGMEFTEMQLQLQKESDTVEYYEMLLSQNENQSILVHDIKKHLQSIALLNEQNEHDKINAYISQLMASSDLRETARICDNELLNAILSRYQKQCLNKNIDFHADVRSGTTNHISHHDMTSLFCNLLDNAMEAAGDIPESFIEISVHKKENTPFIVIVLLNTCRSSPVSDSNGLLVSTKTDKGRHGFGLKSIQKVVKQYQGNLQMYYDQTTATFHTIITLKH